MMVALDPGAESLGAGLTHLVRDGLDQQPQRRRRLLGWQIGSQVRYLLGGVFVRQGQRVDVVDAARHQFLLGARVGGLGAPDITVFLGLVRPAYEDGAGAAQADVDLVAPAVARLDVMEVIGDLFR